MILPWLGAEFVYSLVQRLTVNGTVGPRTLAGRPLRLFFERLEDEVVSRAAPAFAVRELSHASSGSVFAAGATVRFAVSVTGAAPAQFPITPILSRVSSDATGRPALVPCHCFPPETIRETQQSFEITIPRGAKGGMYILEFRNPLRARVCWSLFINEPDGSPASAAVVVPTFTMWGYHESGGFYPGHNRPSADLFIHRLAKAGLLGWASATAVRMITAKLNVHLNQPHWPLHHSIRLDQPFRTNHRWSKWLWDEELSRLEGVWNDDIDILLPFFALADAAGVSLRIYSDLDMDREVPEIHSEKRLVFVGQESLTTRYWRHLSRFAELGGEVVLWCPQGFGYRQVDYDAQSATLRYVCSRGKRGFWGEALEPEDPPWDEGALFGFRFPSPDSPDATNPHRVLYSALRTLEPLHSSSFEIPAGEVFSATIWDGERERPAVNWMGGEPFRRVIPGARVYASMAEDDDVIGFGTYGRCTVVSPTFLGALWSYGLLRQPLVQCLFELAVKG